MLLRKMSVISTIYLELNRKILNPHKIDSSWLLAYELFCHFSIVSTKFPIFLFPWKMCLCVGIRYKCSMKNPTKIKAFVGMFENGKADFGSISNKESRTRDSSEPSVFLIDSKILFFRLFLPCWQIEYMNSCITISDFMQFVCSWR